MPQPHYSEDSPQICEDPIRSLVDQVLASSEIIAAATTRLNNTEPWQEVAIKQIVSNADQIMTSAHESIGRIVVERMK